MSEDRCVLCGAYVPEGRMICPECEAWKKSVPEDNWKRALEYCDNDVRAMKNLSHGEMVQISEEKKSRMQRLIDGRFCTPLTFELTFEQSSKKDTCLMCGRPFKGLVERKKGKWIIDGHHINCDQCGMYMCNTDREGDKFPINFCPNCGAEMEELDADEIY